jgi:hypothetical protein
LDGACSTSEPNAKGINKLKNMEKLLITSVDDYRFLKMTVSEESFKDRFVVSTKITTTILAEDAMVNLYFEDSRVLTAEELDAFKRGNF